MQNKKLVIGISSGIAALILIIAVTCFMIFMYSKSPESTEESVSGNELDEDYIINIPQNEQGENCIPEEYFDSLEDDECKLVYEENLELTWEQPEYDPDSELPPYQQTLVTDSYKFFQTMEGAIAEYMEEQNFETDKWEIVSRSSNEYMFEVMYKAELSTEIHYIYCISSRRVETEEGQANVRIYEKVIVPDAS